MEHLPECRLAYKCQGLTGIEGKHIMKVDYCEACLRTCICDALRACEQRVNERWESLSVLVESYAYKWGKSYAHEIGSDSGFDAGYAAALDAAETAVAMKQTQIAKELMEHLWSNEYPSDDGDCCAEVVVNSALAAICKLREEQ